MNDISREPADKVVVDQRPTPPTLRPRVLVTNDDGIDSPGIRHLAKALAEDYEVVVAAPLTDMSGSGTGIGRLDPSGAVELRNVHLDGLEAFSLAGPPGLAVTAAALGAFGPKPDLVVSGVNAGTNTGHSIIHSGTVGAVLTALTFGSRGLAVSLEPSDPWHWETAVDVARSAARWLLGRKGASALNVNVPGLGLAEVRGVKWADLDEFGHFRVASTDIGESRLQFEVSGTELGLDPASDMVLVRDGYVTVTPVTGVQAAPFPQVGQSDIWDHFR